VLLTDEELLAGIGSDGEPLTEAVLVMTLPEGAPAVVWLTRTLIVSVVLAPEARLPIEQV
jgi:hypothetical protein